MPDPSDISGLILWFEAEDLVGVIADEDPIPTWPDRSGNGRDLTQATSTKRPTWRFDPTSGTGIVQFDGVDDYMKTPAFASPTAGVHVFAVLNLDAPVGAGTIVQHAAGATWADPYARHMTRVDFASTQGLEVWINQYGAPRLVLETVRVEVGVVTLYEMYYDNTTLATFRNLGFQNGTTPSVGLLSSNFPVYVGSNTDGGENLAGYMTSLVVYNRMLTTAERGQVGSYLIGSDADEKIGVTQGGMHV